MGAEHQKEIGRLLYIDDQLGAPPHDSSSYPNTAAPGRRPASPEEAGRAQLVSSETVSGLHAPVLDIDFPARLVPSETPGHYHLYLDVEISWEQYERILVALGDGILEPGYVGASLQRRATFVARKPWKRPADQPAALDLGEAA